MGHRLLAQPSAEVDQGITIIKHHLHQLTYPSVAMEAMPLVQKSIAMLPELTDNEDARLRIYKRLCRDRYKATAIVHAVNEMLNLDPLSKADRETQRQLDELLAKLTGDKPQQRPLHGLSNLQLRTEHDRVLEHWWHQAREFDGAF